MSTFNFWDDYFFFTNKVITTSGFFTKIDYSLPIYRARKYDGFDINDPKELQYPPKESCNKTGRANVPYHPVFYGSYDLECCIMELELKKGEEVVVSEWCWKEKPNLNTKLFSKFESECESLLRSFKIRTIEEYINLAISKKGELKPGTMHYDMINRMHVVCDLFLNENDYFGSAIVAFEELYRSRLNNESDKSDVLIYPSIVCNSGVNLAIHPDIVDKFLTNTNVKLVK